MVDLVMEEHWFVILGYPLHFILAKPYVIDMDFYFGRPKFIQADICLDTWDAYHGRR